MSFAACTASRRALTGLQALLRRWLWEHRGPSFVEGVEGLVGETKMVLIPSLSKETGCKVGWVFLCNQLQWNVGTLLTTKCCHAGVGQGRDAEPWGQCQGQGCPSDHQRSSSIWQIA